MAKFRTGAVEVTGLRELNKALKELGPEFPKEMRKTNKSVADEVRNDARGKALSLGGVAAKTAPTLKSSSGTNSAGVSLGGTTAPWAAGAEFGGGRRSTTRQFKPWRGSGPDAGYFVYPTIRENADDIVDAYNEAIGDLLQRVGLIDHA